MIFTWRSARFLVDDCPLIDIGITEFKRCWLAFTCLTQHAQRLMWLLVGSNMLTRISLKQKDRFESARQGGAKDSVGGVWNRLIGRMGTVWVDDCLSLKLDHGIENMTKVCFLTFLIAAFDTLFALIKQGLRIRGMIKNWQHWYDC